MKNIDELKTLALSMISELAENMDSESRCRALGALNDLPIPRTRESLKAVLIHAVMNNPDLHDHADSIASIMDELFDGLKAA